MTKQTTWKKKEVRSKYISIDQSDKKTEAAADAPSNKGLEVKINIKQRNSRKNNVASATTETI